MLKFPYYDPPNKEHEKSIEMKKWQNIKIQRVKRKPVPITFALIFIPKSANEPHYDFSNYGNRGELQNS